MNLVRGVSYRRVIIGMGLLIVIGGIALAIFSQNQVIGGLSAGSARIVNGPAYFGTFAANLSPLNPDQISAGGAQYSVGQSQIISQQTSEITTMTAAATTTSSVPQAPQQGSGGANTAASSAKSATYQGTSGSIEYFSNVTMISSSPPIATSKVVDIAYMQGGYVAYSSSNANFSFVVIRVPAGNFQTALTDIQALGNVTNVARWSNDVTVQYTDLNATLASLRTEQASLLSILNKSTLVNNTLAIESQIQSVNQQIDLTESQILQAQRLIAYSTISVSISISAKAIKTVPLTLKLAETPKSGVSPLAVTFSAIVQGGVSPYVINYNFGDGSSEQGQIVIHEYGSGDYNASVTVTDSKGNVEMASAMIHVASAPSPSPITGFLGTIGGLFVSVIEGIAEVAVVVIPIGLVGLAVLVPFRRRSRVQKEAKPS